MRKLTTTLLLLALVFPAAARADISGSTVEMEEPASGSAAIGDLVQFRFKVTNASTDLNGIANVQFRFPDCCEVVGMSFDDSEASNDWAFEYVGIGGFVARFEDADQGYGEIIGDGEYGWFMVDLRIHLDCSEGNELIHWLLEGDDYGAEPRDLLGQIPILLVQTPVEGSSWSAVKAGY